MGWWGGVGGHNFVYFLEEKRRLFIARPLAPSTFHRQRPIGVPCAGAGYGSAANECAGLHGYS